MVTIKTLIQALQQASPSGRCVRRIAAALLCGGLAFGMASDAQASNPRYGTPKIRPQISQSGQPLLGFVGQMQFGYGLVVQSVNPGSLADQIGLEPGDVITALNGQPVQSLDMYYTLLRESGGFVQMEAIDSRTGNPAGLDFYLDNGASSPVGCAPVTGGRPGVGAAGMGGGMNGGGVAGFNGSSRPFASQPIRQAPNVIRPNTSNYRPAGTSSGIARPPVIRRY